MYALMGGAAVALAVLGGRRLLRRRRRRAISRALRRAVVHLEAQEHPRVRPHRLMG